MVNVKTKGIKFELKEEPKPDYKKEKKILFYGILVGIVILTFFTILHINQPPAEKQAVQTTTTEVATVQGFSDNSSMLGAWNQIADILKFPPAFSILAILLGIFILINSLLKVGRVF